MLTLNRRVGETELQSGGAKIVAGETLTLKDVELSAEQSIWTGK